MKSKVAKEKVLKARYRDTKCQNQWRNFFVPCQQQQNQLVQIKFLLNLNFQNFGSCQTKIKAI